MNTSHVSLSISKRGTNAEYAKAYDRLWEYLLVPLMRLSLFMEFDRDRPLKSYCSRISGRQKQQHILGHRPYGKQAFVYAFPDFAATTWCTAELLRHWFQLSLALTESELREYIELDGIQITTDFATLADVIAAGNFVQVRGKTWLVRPADPHMYRQGDQGIETLHRSALTSEEVAEVVLVEQGHCRCPVCARLCLSGEHMDRFRKRLQMPGLARHNRYEFFWWVAALQQPDEQLLADILTVWSPYEVQYWPHMPQWEQNAFYWLCYRNSATYAILQAIAHKNSPEQRAAVIHGLRGAYAAGCASDQEVYDAAKPTIIRHGSYAETVAVFQLLRECPPIDDGTKWDQLIREALQQHGDIGALGTQLRDAAVHLWLRLYPERDTPEEVKVKVNEHYTWLQRHAPQKAKVLAHWNTF